MPHWNELGIFAHVVSSGSFSAAADRLGLSKAAVSDAVRRLELRLGVRLLNRSTRSLSLTAAGEACFRHSARLVEEGDLATQSAVALHTKPLGLLRITAPQTFGALHVTPVVTDLLLQNPGLNVELSLSANVVDLVKEKFDLAIRIGPLPSSRLVARRLATVGQIVTAAPSYLERHGIPTSPDALVKHRALQFTPFGWGDEWRLTSPDATRETKVPMQIAFSSDSGEALLAATCAGLGVALLPDWMVHRELAAGSLVRLLPGWGRHGIPVHAVHASGGRAPAKVKACVEALVRRFRTPPWTTDRASRDANAPL